MSRSINQIENVFFPIFGLVYGTNCLGFNRNPPLPLQIHIIQHLGLHFTARQKTGLLNNPICQGGFPMVNMSNNTKISNFTLIYMCHSFPHFYNNNNQAETSAQLKVLYHTCKNPTRDNR